jgi:hypothetical protein
MLKIVLGVVLGFAFLHAKSEMVIYKNSMALVNEDKQIKENKITNLPNTIDVSSIILKDKNIKFFKYVPKKNFLFSQIAKYYINKNIKLKKMVGEYTLIQCSSSECMVKDKHGMVFKVDSKEVVFSKLPKELSNQAYIFVKSDKKLKKIGISYLFKGVSWRCKYDINLDNDNALLSGYFVIKNRTTDDIKKDSIKFMAGDLKINNNHPQILYKSVMDSMPAPSAGVKEKYLDENVLYSLNKPIILKQNEENFIKFLQKDIKITKSYIVRTSSPRYLSTKRDYKPSVEISFKTTDVLPGGDVNIYKNYIFLANAYIGNKPKDSIIKLNIGKNFFVNVEEKLISKEIHKRKYKVKIKYSVSNHSKKDKIIKIKVPFAKSKSNIIKTSKRYKYINANTVEFSIKIKANKTISFNVWYEKK